MIHDLQGALQSLIGGVTAHLDHWVGWATLIAAALFGLRGGSPWLPLVVAIIINPTPYGLVVSLVHGHVVALTGVATYTAIQVFIAYVGYAIGRIVLRFR